MKLKLHEWTNNATDDKEMHYYKDGDSSVYVIGINPKFCSKELREKILELIKTENANHKRRNTNP